MVQVGQRSIDQGNVAVGSIMNMIKNMVSPPKDYINATLQGLGSSAVNIANMFSEPYYVDEEAGEIVPIDTGIVPRAVESYLAENFPAQDSFGPNVFRRAGANAPFLAAGGPLAMLARSGIAGLSGQVAEELGAPQWGQNLAELLGGALPGIEKSIPSFAMNAEKEAAREFGTLKGLSPETQALSIPRGGKIDQGLTAIASKGNKLQEGFSTAQKELGMVYEGLREGPYGSRPLGYQPKVALAKDLNQTIAKLPSEVANRISGDVNKFLSSGQTGADIITLHQNLNHYINSGAKQVGNLKEPLAKALKTIAPEFGKDFEMANKLYSNFAKFRKSLTPKIADSMLSQGESGAMMYGVMTGNSGLLQKTLGLVGARKIAQELLTNPRLQNMSGRLVESLKTNSPQITKNLYNSLVRQVSSKDPEAAQKLASFNWDDFYLAKDQQSSNDRVTQQSEWFDEFYD